MVLFNVPSGLEARPERWYQLNKVWHIVLLKWLDHNKIPAHEPLFIEG